VTNEPRLPAHLEPSAQALVSDTTLTGVALHGQTVADAEYVELAACRLDHVTFTGATLQRLRLVDVVLGDCELSGTTLDDATLHRVRFLRCRMAGAIAPSLKAVDVEFLECKLDNANLRNASFERVAFIQCLLPDADFYGGMLKGSRFERCDLSRVEFSKAKLDGVDVRTSTIDGIGGGASLKGLIAGSDQVVPLAFSLFAAMGISIDDDS
jgi:uncharacterized protein YjbI with pentapeptide repeats